MTAQDVIKPSAGEAGRTGVDLGVNHVRRHDAAQRGIKPAIRGRIICQDRLQTAPVHRHVGVRIGFCKPVTRKMLAAIGHAALQQTLHQAPGQQADDSRVTRKRTVADDAAVPVVQIEDRCEAQVDPAGAQLRSQDKTASGGRIAGLHGAGPLTAPAILQPHLSQRIHGRQMGETVGSETLHPTTLVVHTNEQVSPDGLDVAAKFC